MVHFLKKVSISGVFLKTFTNSVITHRIKLLHVKITFLFYRARTNIPMIQYTVHLLGMKVDNFTKVV